jgi:hypothetical protein
MDLTATWQEYQSRDFHISTKQQQLILTLAKKLKSQSITNEIVLFKTLSVYLKREVTAWSDLKADEVSRVVYILRSQQIPTKTDLKIVTEQYPLEVVNEVLSKNRPNDRPITEYTGLNHGQVQLILGYKRRFKTQYQDHPLVANADYEYGWQESTLCQDNRMYYLKFYDLMMLDYDNITYEELLEIVQPQLTDHYFEIHQTFNGYHVFLLSELVNHRDPHSKELMIQLHSDHYYMMFCHVNGYKIRLSRKIGRAETYISQVVGTVGNPEKLNSDCQRLLRIFHDYLKDIHNASQPIIGCDDGHRQT